MASEWPDDSIFEPFDVFEETYKTVGSHEIKTAILIPKSLTPGAHPIILNVHGGFLTTAHSLFAPLFSPWALDLASQNSAIIVSADYRLLPSENGVADLLEDLEDWWKWTRSELPGVLERRDPRHSVNFDKLLLVGSSAGGYCVIQLAISHPDEVKAVAMGYPVVDSEDHIFRTGPNAEEPTILHTPLDTMPSKDDVETWIKEERKVITTKAGFERHIFNVAATQYGLFYSHIFDNKNLDHPDFVPFKRLENGGRLPKKLWIVHGDSDSVVYIRGTHKFLKLLEDKKLDTVVRFDVAKGYDHAFDHLNPNWESFIEPGALEFVSKSWLED